MRTSAIGRILAQINRIRIPFATLLALAIFFGLLTLIPPFLHVLHPSFQGLTIIRDKDFGNYFSRLERALIGFSSEAANGITPIGSGIEGTQSAGLEKILGFLFGWTGIPAPNLALLLTPLFAFFLFLLLYKLFRTIECTPRWALGAVSLYFFILFHVVTRVMHPGWSFVPVIGAFLAFLNFWRRPSILAALFAGLLLGVLPYLYFWGWTFVWASCGIAVILAFLTRCPDDPLPQHRKLVILLTGIVLLVAVPFALHTYALSQLPAFPDVVRRGGFLMTRGVESWPRSALLALDVLLLLSLFRRAKHHLSYLITLSLLLGIFLAMHQNILHGTLLMFSSHYEPFFVLTTFLAALWVITHPTALLQRTGIIFIAAAFLAGAAFDYLPGYRYFLVQEQQFQDQPLIYPIRTLRGNGTRDTVLTDAATGRVLMSWTGEGIVYTTHMRFLLVSDEEMAERYCLSELFAPESPPAHRALYMEYNALLDSSEMREREQILVTTACERVRSDPLPYLRKYGVTHALWNARTRPEWNVTTYDLPWRVLDASNDGILLSLEAPSS